MSGPDLAALMKVGTRVMRGVDWKWGDQVIFLDLWKKRMNLIVLVRNLLFICREDVLKRFITFYHQDGPPPSLGHVIGELGVQRRCIEKIHNFLSPGWPPSKFGPCDR